jgi:hypothetical protein
MAALLAGIALLAIVGVMGRNSDGFVGSVTSFCLAPLSWPRADGKRRTQVTSYVVTLVLWLVVAYVVGTTVLALPPARG